MFICSREIKDLDLTPSYVLARKRKKYSFSASASPAWNTITNPLTAVLAVFSFTFPPNISVAFSAARVTFAVKLWSRKKALMPKATPTNTHCAMETGIAHNTPTGAKSARE